MSDERRQQIVDAARQLYEEQGLSATTAVSYTHLTLPTNSRV